MNLRLKLILKGTREKNCLASYKEIVHSFSLSFMRHFNKGVKVFRWNGQEVGLGLLDGWNVTYTICFFDFH